MLRLYPRYIFMIIPGITKISNRSIFLPIGIWSKVGYIFATKDVAKSDFGKKEKTKKVKELAMSRLISEVKNI